MGAANFADFAQHHGAGLFGLFAHGERGCQGRRIGARAAHFHLRLLVASTGLAANRSTVMKPD